MDNCSTDEPTLRFELDRYLGWPGQAPSYKVGERIWLEARDDARRRQGARLRPAPVPRRRVEPRAAGTRSAARTRSLGSERIVMTTAAIRLILASASPARLRTLRASRTGPEVDRLRGRRGSDGRGRQRAGAGRATGPAQGRGGRGLDRRRTEAHGGDRLRLAAGAGRRPAYGKPASAAEAVRRWRRMRGRSRRAAHRSPRDPQRRSGDVLVRSAVASTTVHFAGPERRRDRRVRGQRRAAGQVAGAFTIDGLGGAFVTRIEGDHHNVVGISLPLLRLMLADLGVPGRPCGISAAEGLLKDQPWRPAGRGGGPRLAP